MNADLNKIQADELFAVVQESITYFQKALRTNGLVVTGELMTSFQTHLVTNSNIIAADISFNVGGRYKDMKTLGWRFSGPPVEIMEKFVTKHGLSKFGYIPGYENGKMPSGKDRKGNDKGIPVETLAFRRLAWIMNRSFVKKSRQRKQGSWYNETKMNLINVTRARVLHQTNLYLLQNFADTIQKND